MIVRKGKTYFQLFFKNSVNKYDAVKNVSSKQGGNLLLPVDVVMPGLTS